MTALHRARNRGFPAMAVAGLRAAQASALRALGRTQVRRRIHSYEMFLDLDDPGISRSLNLFGSREGDMRFMLEKNLKLGMTVFDIGSNIGYYPLLELQIMRGMGRLVCIEPVPSNVRLLIANLAHNNYWPDIVEAAVSDKDGAKEFHFAEHSNLGSFHPVDYVECDGLTTVRTLSLATLIDKYGIPDLIRMDIEGHEVEVLGGLIECLNAIPQAPIVIFETHHDRYTPEHDMENVLADLCEFYGYHVEMVSSAHEDITPRIEAMGYKPITEIKTDATIRTIFGPIKLFDALDLICGRGGARTVMLKRGH